VVDAAYAGRVERTGRVVRTGMEERKARLGMLGDRELVKLTMVTSRKRARSMVLSGGNY